MLARGKAKKLSIYVNETDTRHGRPLYEALVALAKKHRLAGATVSRGVMGYAGDGPVHTTGLVEAGGHLPLKVELVDTPEAIEHLLPDVYEMVDGGLVELADVEVIKASPAAPPTSKPPAHHKVARRARMLQVHFGADDEWEGEPLHEALTKRLHLMDIAGVTVYRGLLGYGESGRIHRRKVWRSTDEPVTVVVVDTPEHINQALPVVDQMVQHGMAVVTDVDAIFYTR
jgi:PII-like signaling protein